LNLLALLKNFIVCFIRQTSVLLIAIFNTPTSMIVFFCSIGQWAS